MASYGQINNEGDVRGTPLAPINMQPVQSYTSGVMSQMRAAYEKDMGEIRDTMESVYNYRMEEEAKTQLDDIQTRAEAEARAGMESAPGSAKSWYLEDGTLDNEKIADFRNRYDAEYNSVNPILWGTDAQISWGKRKAEYLRNSSSRLTGQAIEGQLQATKRVANASLENALRKNDMKAFATEAYRQADAGILTRVEAENKILKAAKTRIGSGSGGMGGGGAVNIGGHVMNGFNARLFAARAREGQKPLTPEEYDQMGLEAMMKEEEVGKAEPAEAVKADSSGGVTITPESNELELSMTPGQKWAYTGDSENILQGMTDSEYETVQTRLSDWEDTIRLDIGDDGIERFDAGIRTSEPVQAIVAGANERGGLSYDEAYQAADDIATGYAIENPALSEETISKSLEALAVPLGGGEEEQGKLVLKDIVSTAKQRAGKTNFTIMSQEAIENMAEMTVTGTRGDRRDDSGKELDWAFMERLNRTIKAREKTADEKGFAGPRPKFFERMFGTGDTGEFSEADKQRAYAHFKQNVNDYDPNLAQLSEDELKKAFEEKGGDYIKWYWSEYGKDEQKEAHENAVAELEARIKQAQQREMTGNKEYNYVNDVDVAKDVCKGYRGMNQRTLENISKYHANQRGIMEKTQMLLRAKMQRAEDAKAALSRQGELNAAEEAEQKYQKKKQDKERAAADKAAADFEKRKETAKFLNERNKLTVVDWDFDNVDRGNFGGMSVRLTKSEWQRVKEKMGYDETKTVYIKIDGIAQNIPVDMTCPAKGGKMECSAALVAKMQLKPTGRGKNRVVPPVITSGEVGIRYIIKNVPKE